MENFSDVFKILQKDNANKMCIDCKKPYPLYASINNGVFICEMCSEIHKNFGYEISYIRALKDKWDEYLLSYMERGGNERFAKTMDQFSIIEVNDPFYKYKTKGAENYRKTVNLLSNLQLRSEVLAEEPPVRIHSSEGNLPLVIEGKESYQYPEFEDYHLIKEDDTHNYENYNPSAKKGLFNKLTTYVKNVSKSIGEKIKSTGSKANVILKKTGGFVVMKSHVIKDKAGSGIGKFTGKVKDGALKISENTKKIYANIKTKITTKKGTEEINNIDDKEIIGQKVFDNAT